MDPEMFQIVFWSSLLLIVAAVGSVGVLAALDPTDDAMLYALDPLKKGM
jgi:hypothetical protein